MADAALTAAGARHRRARALALGVVAGAVTLALARCGGSASAGGAGSPGGAAVFARSCQVCHSLVGNDSERKQGGDLVGYRISRAALTQFTREMPVKRRLDAAELRAVVSFVRAAEQRGRG